MADVTQVELWIPDDVVYLCSEGQSAVEDDTHTLDLRGRRNSEVING